MQARGIEFRWVVFSGLIVGEDGLVVWWDWVDGVPGVVLSPLRQGCVLPDLVRLVPLLCFPVFGQALVDIVSGFRLVGVGCPGGQWCLIPVVSGGLRAVVFMLYSLVDVVGEG
jgi:hypothetical protein